MRFQYSKRLEFADAEVVNPNSLWQPAFDKFTNGPRLHEFLNEMNTKVFQPYEYVLNLVQPDQALSDVIPVASSFRLQCRVDR